jgi:hypothetical protein
VAYVVKKAGELLVRYRDLGSSRSGEALCVAW